MPFDYWVNKYYVYSVEQMVFNEEFEKNKNIFLDKTFSTQFIHVWLGLLKKTPIHSYKTCYSSCFINLANRATQNWI